MYYGGKTHYSKRIGIEPLGADRVTHWRCPICDYEWKASSNDQGNRPA